MLSKPMTEMSRGTRRPNSLIAPMAPIAVRSLEANTAVGRVPDSRMRFMASWPPSTR